MTRAHSFRKYVLRAGAYILGAFFLYALSASAEGPLPKYTPLVNLPGLNPNDNTTLPQYLNGIYVVIISLGAFYGVIKISIAGVKYSLTDVVTIKGDAKNDILGVLLGLLILLMPYIVLKTINPDLLSLDVLSGVMNISGKPTYYGKSRFACETPECQQRCRSNNNGTIKEENGVSVCSYDVSSNFRPPVALARGTETLTYIECRQANRVYDEMSRSCGQEDRWAFSNKRIACTDWGGTFTPDPRLRQDVGGTCQPKEIISAETYKTDQSNTSAWLDGGRTDMEKSWDVECASKSGTLKVVKDDEFTTFMCLK